MLTEHTLLTKPSQLSLIQEETDFLNGLPVYTFILQNTDITIKLTNYGCTIMSVVTPDQFGHFKNIISGFASPMDYLENKYYFGSVIGRYANRIGKGKFTLDGELVQLSINNNGNHLHGGFKGFNSKLWTVVSINKNEQEAAVVMEYKSKDGEEGYPGNVSAQVTYKLNNKNQLFIHYAATTDKATPISLTNHSYFNLSGFEQPRILDHLLQINASAITEKNEYNLPTGKFLDVRNTPFDFTTFKTIGRDIHELKYDGGYDHNFILKYAKNNTLQEAAQLYDPSSGRTLQVFTDQPGIQVYTANFWANDTTGANGEAYVQHGAVALETQSFPDSPNHPHFPSGILPPGEQYDSTTIFQFGIR